MGIGTLGFHLLAQFGIGSLILMAWVPPPREGRGFGAFLGASSLVFLVLGIAAGGMPLLRGEVGGPWVRAGLVVSLAGTAVVAGASLAGRDGIARTAAWTVAVAGSVFLIGTARVGLAAGAAPNAPAGMDHVHYWVSSLLLGAVWGAMVLGHWYLVAPGMPLAPLRRLTRAFVALAVTKGVLLLPTLVLLATGDPIRPGGLWLGLNAFECMLVLARILVGVGATVGLGWMTLKTLDLRSTTSATGLLYVAIVIVAMGEVFARMFAHTVGVNL